MTERSHLAWRFPLAFGALVLCLFVLLFLSWRSYGEWQSAQRAQLQAEKVLAQLAALERQVTPDAALALCAASGALPGAPAAAAAGDWAGTLGVLRRLVATDAAQLQRVGALDGALQEWQQLYVQPLQRACSEGQRLGSAYVQSLYRVAEDTRARAVSTIAGLHNLAAGQQAALATQLQTSIESNRRLFMLTGAAALLLGVVSLLAMRGFTAQLTESSRALRREATERGVAKEQLLDSQRRLRMLLEHITDAVIAFDAQGKIQWLNPAGELLFRRSRQSVSTEPIAALIPALAEDLDWPVTQPQAELDGLSPTPWTARRDTVTGLRPEPDGEFPLEIALVQTQVEGDRIGICLCRDLSETDRVERLKSGFIDSVRGELHEPLRSIRDALGSIGVPADGSAEARLRIARRDSERLLRLTDDLLEMERLRSGEAPMAIAALDLAQAARLALEAGRPAALRHQIELRLMGDGEPLPVLADAEHLAQALDRLVARAIDASPLGGQVDIVTNRREDEGMVWVIDSGPGLPEAVAERLFEPFAPGDPEVGGRRGSSLALPICKLLVERTGGRIGLAPPQDGRGAALWMSLPLRPGGR